MAKNITKLASLLLIGFSLVMSGCNCGGGKDPSDIVEPTSQDPTPGPSSPTPTPGSSETPSSHTPTGDTWKVSFDYNYETGFKTYLTVDVKDGDKVGKPENPKRLGYDFVDWFKDPYCRLDRKWDFNTPITKNTTIYASWERNDDPIEETNFEISYQPCLGASFVPMEGESLKYIAEYGDVVQFKIEVDTEHYEGTPVVQANGKDVEAKDGVYTYTVTEKVVFTITGLSKIKAGAYFVYFTNPFGWEAVNMYVWDSSVTEEGVDTGKVAWPGEEMMYDANTGLMMYEIESPDEFNYDKVIFNAGMTGGQTADLDLVITNPSGATLYYGEGDAILNKAFDPKSDNASIVWGESSDYRFTSVDGSALPTQVKKGTKVSFKLDILLENHVGDVKVLVNRDEVTAVNGVYSFTVNSLFIEVKATGIAKAGVVDLYYTIPSWDPPVTNPKIYYWGTDASGAFMSNTIDWDNASDTQGSMQNVSGNDYKFTIDFDDGMSITGVIVVMYQDGAKKQSQDIVTSITAAGEYQITFVNEWVDDKFSATLNKRG